MDIEREDTTHGRFAQPINALLAKHAVGADLVRLKVFGYRGIAGNDPKARETVANIMFDLGVDPWDAGPLRFARLFDAFNSATRAGADLRAVAAPPSADGSTTAVMMHALQLEIDRELKHSQQRIW